MIDFVRVVSAGVCLTLAAGLAGAVSIEPAATTRPSAHTAPASAVEWRVTVRSIIDARGLGRELRAGRLLSAVTHRVIEPTAFPPTVLVDGQPGRLDQEVRADAAVEVLPGRDEVEPVVRRVIAQQADTRAGLFLPGTSGLVELHLGKLSGEVVSKRVIRQPRHGALRTPGSILLTFDDGPDPVWTPQILELLKRHHAHAIFCVIGRDVRRYPALVRRIVAEGHVLCNHTENHDEQLAVESTGVALGEMLSAARAIEQVTGRPARYFRAPGGGWTPALEQLVERAGMVPLKWNVDPRDWERPSARTIVSRVVAEARPGSVVLLHDGGGDRGTTVSALQTLLNLLPRLRLRVAEPAVLPAGP